MPRVKWYHNGNPVREQKGMTMSLSPRGEAVIHFQEIFPEDAGMYECKAVNPAGQAITSANLLVESKKSTLNRSLQHIQTTVASVLGYEYIPDSESASLTAGPSGQWEDITGPSGSEDDMLSDKQPAAHKAESRIRKFAQQPSKDDDMVVDSGVAPRFVVPLQETVQVVDGSTAR